MSIVKYYLWVGVVLFCPSLLVYIPAVMFVTWLVCQWVKSEINRAYDKACETMPKELVPPRCDVDESLEEGTRICVGWSPLLPMTPVLLAAMAIVMAVSVND